ncbi:hypothetical protein BKA64DRAFT_733657 [Cadophora sp. MPI-SDFR-AT-0126]|nr:hypothetical protein BKA64DRAFT_733657 [Leotiomycetes sp. MPI-SDFR-AT-0126]
MISRRNRYLFIISICLVLLVSTFRYRPQFSELELSHTHKFKYKPVPKIVPDPIIDNFPLAAAAHSPQDLPPIPPWNRPPAEHVPENTPLFIGFTRNWRILQQVVVSYITAGWPAEDIYVIENTGVFDSNAKGLLSLQNPFFLNHTRLHLFGVNILVTPTLLSFAQLQNYYIWHSIEMGWKQYFWGHMDIVAMSFEDRYVDPGSSGDGTEKGEKGDVGGAGAGAGAGEDVKNDEMNKYKNFKSLYMSCVQALREATKKDDGSSADRRWAMRFFNYDKLALVNVAGFVEIGAWDTQIPYYMTDCDMHARLNMAGLEIKDAPAGFLIDVGESLNDLYTLYRKSDSPPAAFIDPQILERKKKKKGKRAAEDAPNASEAENDIVSRSVDSVFELKRDAAPRPLLAKDSKSEKREANETSSKTAWYTHLLSPTSPGPRPTSPNNNNTQHTPSDTINSPSFTHLLNTLEAMQHTKAAGSHGRNMWQARQRGGQDDPFYRNAVGFERGIVMAIDHGKEVFAEKWGHRGCDVWELGLGLGDAWRVERDW